MHDFGSQLIALAASACLVATGTVATAQTTPRRFRVSVEVVALTVDTASDRVTVSYRVLNSPESTDSLAQFRVDAPTGRLRVSEPSDSWYADTQFVRRPIASWALLGKFLRPGERTPPLTFDAPGVPGIVRYWATRYVPLKWVESADEDPPGYKPPSIESQLAKDSDIGFTVGVVRPPADRSAIGLAKHVRVLVSRSCTLKWIDDPESCDSLGATLAGEPTRWQDFLRERDTRRGKHVNDAAYFLLLGNVELARSTSHTSRR